MKVNNVDCSLERYTDNEIIEEAIWGGTYKFIFDPDGLNNTSLINATTRILYNSKDRAEVTLSIDDNIVLIIPSGRLYGRIYKFKKKGEHRIEIKLGPAGWEGQYAGMDYGSSGMFTFNLDIPRDRKIETSAWDNPIPFSVYKLARKIVETRLDLYSAPLAKQDALRDAIKFILKMEKKMLVYQERGGE